MNNEQKLNNLHLKPSTETLLALLSRSSVVDIDSLTFDELFDIFCENLPDSGCGLTKKQSGYLSRIGRGLLSKAVSPEEVRVVFDLAPPESKIKVEAMKRMAEMSKHPIPGFPYYHRFHPMAIYEFAPYGSRLETGCLERMLDHVYSPSSFYDVNKLYDLSPYGSEIEATLLSRRIQSASSVDQLKMVYSDTVPGSKNEAEVIKKLNQKGEELLSKTSEFDKILALYKGNTYANVLPNCKFKTSVLKKIEVVGRVILSQSNSFSEKKLLYDKIPSEIKFKTEVLREILKMDLSHAEIDSIFDKAFESYGFISRDDRLRKKALFKMLKCTSSFNEAEKVYSVARNDKLRHEALKLMLKFSLSYDEAKYVYDSTIDDKLKREALTRMMFLATDIEQARFVCWKLSSESKLYTEAFRRMMKIIPTFNGALRIYRDIEKSNKRLRLIVLKRMLQLAECFEEIKTVFNKAPYSDLKKESLKRLLELT